MFPQSRHLSFSTTKPSCPTESPSLVHTPLYQYRLASKVKPLTCRTLLLPHLQIPLCDTVPLTLNDPALYFYGVPERAERVIRLNSLNMIWVMPASGARAVSRRPVISQW